MKRNDRDAVAVQVRLAEQLENRALRARNAICSHATRCVDCKNEQSALLVLQQLVSQRLRIDGRESPFESDARTQRRLDRAARARASVRPHAELSSAAV